MFPGSRNVPNVPDVKNVPNVPNNVPNVPGGVGQDGLLAEGFVGQNGLLAEGSVAKIRMLRLKIGSGMLRLSSCMLRLGLRLSVGSCMLRLKLRLRLSFRGSGERSARSERSEHEQSSGTT